MTFLTITVVGSIHLPSIDEAWQTRQINRVDS